MKVRYPIEHFDLTIVPLALHLITLKEGLTQTVFEKIMLEANLFINL